MTDKKTQPLDGRAVHPPRPKLTHDVSGSSHLGDHQPSPDRHTRQEAD